MSICNKSITIYNCGNVHISQCKISLFYAYQFICVRVLMDRISETSKSGFVRVYIRKQTGQVMITEAFIMTTVGRCMIFIVVAYLVNTTLHQWFCSFDRQWIWGRAVEIADEAYSMAEMVVAAGVCTLVSPATPYVYSPILTNQEIIPNIIPV